MALKNVKLGLALVLVGMLCYKATAQSGCTSVLMGLAPCLNYIAGNSTTPASSCCSQLSSVVQSQPQCLCSALSGGGSSLGITINQTRALSLPGVDFLPAANGPAAPPVSSTASPPADSSDETPDTPATSSMPSIPSGTGSKTVPTKENSISNGNIMKMPLTLTLFTLFIASYISLITLC